MRRKIGVHLKCTQMRSYQIAMVLCMLCLPGYAAAQTIVAQVPISSSSCCAVAFNPALNVIYTSGGYSSGQNVSVIDGNTFAVTATVAGAGAAVDTKTDNYWAGEVYSGSTTVYDSSNSLVATVSTGYCPGQVTFDCKRRYMWVATQCGGGNDPVFAVDANTFGLLSGPIGSGGVQGPVIVNPATGVLYIFPSGVSKRVDPQTFAVTNNSFGEVGAVDPVLNRVYATSGNSLQIVGGASEAVLHTVKLSYTPSSYLGVNNALDHLYVSNASAHAIEVLSDATGKLLGSLPLGSGVTPQQIAVDSTRGRVLVTVATASGNFLYVIDDLTTVRVCGSRGSC